jgi:hypothetical protein
MKFQRSGSGRLRFCNSRDAEGPELQAKNQYCGVFCDKTESVLCLHSVHMAHRTV